MAIEFNSVDSALLVYSSAFGSAAYTSSSCYYVEFKLLAGGLQNFFSTGHPEGNVAYQRHTPFVNAEGKVGLRHFNDTVFDIVPEIGRWYAMFVNYVSGANAILVALAPVDDPEIPFVFAFESTTFGSAYGRHHVGGRQVSGSTYEYSTVVLGKLGVWPGGFDGGEVNWRHTMENIDTYRPDECMYFDNLKPAGKAVGDGLKTHLWVSQRGGIFTAGINSATIDDTPRVAEDPPYYWMGGKPSLLIGENPLFVVPQIL